MTKFAEFWLFYFTLIISIIAALVYDLRILLASFCLVVVYIALWVFSKDDIITERSLKQCRSEKDEHEQFPHDFVSRKDRINDK
jgi:hypothetical protein